jgi:TPR repeat protein
MPGSDELLLAGLLCLEDETDPAQRARGRDLIVQAAELGHPDALHYAYLILSQGWHGDFDRVTAFRYLIRAAEQDHLEAIYSLGYCYLAGGMGNIGYSDEILAQQPVLRDEIKGMELLHRAAGRGHGLAALRIAEHLEGDAETDSTKLQQAIAWYQRGADLGEANCLIHLADFMILGRGLDRDQKRAKRLYEAALKSDDCCATQVASQRLRDFNRLSEILSD